VIAALVLALVIGPGAQGAEGGIGAPRAIEPGAVQGAPPIKEETITAVIVHGNQIVSDDEVIKLSGITIGAPFTASTIAEVTQKLKASGKFKSVDVQKGWASIDDATKIIVIINASEGSVRISDPFHLNGGDPQVVKRGLLGSWQAFPMFDAEDGYGITFGVRMSYPDVIGPGSRLSFPMTWGGTRQIGAELERSFTKGVLSRVQFGTAIQQRRNPGYDENDLRKRVWGRAEKRFGPFRAGGIFGWQRVAFGAIKEDFRSAGVEAVFDTRIDPVLPRNAVFVTATAERLFFEARESIVRTRVDARAFIGTFGQQVLVVRALREDANQAQPLYLRSLLGGWSNLRGFEAGFKTGDTLVATSLEYRIPISSPLSVGKLGVSVFADWGTAYEKGQRFRDQTLDQGVGASVWLALTGFRLSVGVAHGKGATTRFSFGGGLTF